MDSPSFIQIHSLIPYSASLLNRDDSGFPKRLIYGDGMRTRISSQSLKRSYRNSDLMESLYDNVLIQRSYRSRSAIESQVTLPLINEFAPDESKIKECAEVLIKAVYGDKAKYGTNDNRQTLLLGAPEISYLRERLRIIYLGNDVLDMKSEREHWRAFRESSVMYGGLTAAMFGRMVTSDPAANIDGAIYVAHSFTTHSVATEHDYFTAVDDLANEDATGAGSH